MFWMVLVAAVFMRLHAEVLALQSATTQTRFMPQEDAASTNGSFVMIATCWRCRSSSVYDTWNFRFFSYHCLSVSGFLPPTTFRLRLHDRDD